MKEKPSTCLHDLPTEILLLIFRQLDEDSLLHIVPYSSRTRLMAMSLALERRSVILSEDMSADSLTVCTSDGRFILLHEAHFITSVNTVHIRLGDAHGWDQHGVTWWANRVISFVKRIPRIRILEVYLSSGGFWVDALKLFLDSLEGGAYQEINFTSLPLANYDEDADDVAIDSQAESVSISNSPIFPPLTCKQLPKTPVRNVRISTLG